MIKNVIGKVFYDKAILTRHKEENVVAKAPGMKYRHYAPEGSLTIYEGSIDKVAAVINNKAKKYIEVGNRVGIIATEETKHLYKYGIIKVIGSRSD